MLCLILGTAHHDELPIFNEIMLVFVIPLTFVTFVVIFVRAALLRRKPVS